MSQIEGQNEKKKHKELDRYRNGEKKSNEIFDISMAKLQNFFRIY